MEFDMTEVDDTKGVAYDVDATEFDVNQGADVP